MYGLNRQNIFQRLEFNYPQAWEAFEEWLDEYKKEVGWKLLFGWSGKDIWDLPLEMQTGLLHRFMLEYTNQPCEEMTIEWWQQILVDVFIKIQQIEKEEKK